MMPIGMFTKKAQRQLKSWASHPPSSGPRPAAPPKMAPQRPKAAARWRPSNSTLMTAMEDGSIIAAPAAWTAREAIRNEGSWADPLPRDPSKKMTMPIKKSLRLPKRSDSKPMVISNEANTSE